MSLYLGTTPIANTGYDKANTDLSNLTNTGKNIANWSNNVTNCITEIPQDIKLELNNGTLTLKAGSKVYVPNGVGVFDEVVIASDLTRSDTTLRTKDPCFYILEENRILPYQGFSGPTAPTFIGQGIWYDTTNNLCKRSVNGGSTWDTVHASLPCALVTNDGTEYTSIDQVFNGFGYIGSTVFALPNVKGLIPNGRNADGTLKNIEITLDDVKTHTETATANGKEIYILLRNTGVIGAQNQKTSTQIRYYDTDKNFYWNGTSYVSWAIIALFDTDANKKISNLNSKTTFHALDYNDSSTISGWSMPSSRYIDLTLGASGATYTAPANGFVTISKSTNGTNQYLYIHSKLWTQGSANPSSYSLEIFCPVTKGEQFKIAYNAGGAVNIFRFVYAEGEN